MQNVLRNFILNVLWPVAERQITPMPPGLLTSISDWNRSKPTDQPMRKLVITCGALIMVGAAVHAQQTRSPTAAEILSKVASVYAGCHTYSDEGETNIGFAGMPVRPQCFRIVFITPPEFGLHL